MTEYAFETPTKLAGRLKLGREEFAQRLLTSLILHAPYPKWNTAHHPSAAGMLFLERVHALSFPDAVWSSDEVLFVDEFELRPRDLTERGGSPDYCVLTPSMVWMIELKTERASHRATQIPSYFELARHHHPDHDIALTYLTPPMTHTYASPIGAYAHLTWAQVVPIIRSTWADAAAPGQREVVDGLCAVLEHLDEPPAEQIARLRPADAADPERAIIGQAMDAARQTSVDGQQRALDVSAPGLDDLIELRTEIRDAIAAAPADDAIRHVRPWVWTESSGGAPLTDAGGEFGAEIRLSRYRNPLPSPG